MVTSVRPDASRCEVPQTLPEKAPEKPMPDRWKLEQAKRARVREAAARLFAERGPCGVTKWAVLDTVGVHHREADRLFGPVEGLLYEVLSEFLHGLGTAVGGAVRPER